MSKNLGWIFGLLKNKYNVDTNGMTPEEAFEALREQEREGYKSLGAYNADSIKEQVKASADEIEKTDTLMEIPDNEVSDNYLELAAKVQTQLEKSGGVVTREGFGDIQVSSRLSQAAAYFKTTIEKTAVLAISAVLKNGIKIGEHNDHKGRGYPTYTFAGKVSLAGQSGIMAVTVKKTTKNFYKIHRVLTPDGKTLEMEKPPIS